MYRRRASGRGFTLIEALVALSVSAMTLSLLAGAGFGLQQARQTERAADMPLDQIITRRVLREWVGAATKPDPGSVGVFEADGQSMAMRTAKGEVMRLTITTEDQRSTLTATRAGQLRDVRMIPETAEASVLLTVPGTLRFTYLMKTGLRGTIRDWLDVVEAGDGLPIAVGLELGETRIAIAPIIATAGGPCVVSYGMSENGAIECALR